MKYLLDTCVISDFVKGDSNTLHRIKSVSPEKISVSSITVMEIFYGLNLNPKRAMKIKPIIDELINVVNIIPFTHEDAYFTAKIRSVLKEEECPIGSYDILIAGTALNHKLILVSSNLKEFTRVQNLKIENWREK